MTTEVGMHPATDLVNPHCLIQMLTQQATPALKLLGRLLRLDSSIEIGII